MEIKVALPELREDLARRVRIACNLQAGFGHRVKYVPVADRDCQILFVESAAAGAADRIRQAVSSGVTVVVFGVVDLPGQAGIVVADDRSIAELASDIQAAIALRRERPVAAANGHAGGDAVGNRGRLGPGQLLERLAGPDLAGSGNLKVTAGSVVLLIRRGTSRVLGRSHSDIMAGAERLAQEGGQIEAIVDFDPKHYASWAARSLDSFLVRLAKAAPGLPPAREDLSFRLDDWPDLAESGDQVAIHVAARLVAGPANIAQLARETGAEPDALSRLLWAFRAAGLLADGAGTRPGAGASVQQPIVRPAASRPGLLTRIARRFGLEMAR
ncbi:MAG: hypothetical protein KF823_05370 [Xanthomonadales bacterium]|nr:hypothetical protein [Xanthomonadales bacterium]